MKRDQKWINFNCSKTIVLRALVFTSKSKRRNVKWPIIKKIKKFKWISWMCLSNNHWQKKIELKKFIDIEIWWVRATSILNYLVRSFYDENWSCLVGKHFRHRSRELDKMNLNKKSFCVSFDCITLQSFVS